MADSAFPELADEVLLYSPEVEAALAELLPSDDPLDQRDFNTTDYINGLFPNEQSLVNIDTVISDIEGRISTLDEEIALVVRDESGISEAGDDALLQTDGAIQELFTKILDIKQKAERSEAAVQEITADIRQLDQAKRNLTGSIQALHQLQMLTSGVEQLTHFTAARQYSDAEQLLRALHHVQDHFEAYMQHAPLQNLTTRLKELEKELANHILADFKESLEGRGLTRETVTQLSDGCRVIDCLGGNVKFELINWFVKLKMQMYTVLFSDGEEQAWVDKIKNRYNWVKQQLVDFETQLGDKLFPANWEMAERICVSFCKQTRADIARLMERRRSEITVEILLAAIESTTRFENLVSKRFTGVTITGDLKDDKDQSPFVGFISSAFEPFLSIYIESQDRNLATMITKYQAESRTAPAQSTSSATNVLPSCGDLFLYFKKSLQQILQLGCSGEPLLQLGRVFSKYLREYAGVVLMGALPRANAAAPRDVSSAGAFIQNLLKETDVAKLSATDVGRICSVLCTAEYCADTTQQLAEKLREKVTPPLVDGVDFAAEQELFHQVLGQCIALLVTHVESLCEPSLVALTKLNWSTLDSVGDQSGYVTTLVGHLRSSVPVVRDNLAASRKYFTQFCIKLVSALMNRYAQALFRCRPGANTVACEQLLLDTQAIKSVLLDLPNLGSQVGRKAPAALTRLVARDLGRLEMCLKAVMAPAEPVHQFVEHYARLLPSSDVGEFTRVLEMKTLRRQEQQILLELYRGVLPPAERDNEVHQASAASAAAVLTPLEEDSKIRRLEKLIKRHLIE